MPLRLIEVCAPDKRKKDIHALAEKHNAIDVWDGPRNTDGRRPVSILTTVENQQALMDKLQDQLAPEKNWRMNIHYVEATIPKLEKEDKEAPGKKTVKGSSLTREELYTQLEKSALLNTDFVLFVLLSALVCSIGLIQNSVAVIIGAMVIAPLLGPNLSLAFGISLGDRDLVAQSTLTNATGLLMTVFLAYAAGWALPIALDSAELLARTEVGFDSLALALASGAAAVLSLTTGVSTSLVGVMVAVALMPPAVTFGVMAGAGEMKLAYGAALLLAVNVVSVAIAAQSVFLLKGFKPRTWYMRAKSRQSVKLSLFFWMLMLAAVALLIYFHRL